MVKYGRSEKPLSPGPPAKRKITPKGKKNIYLDSSGKADMVEIDSSIDSESNPNSEDQLEDEKANNSLIATNDTSERSPKKSEHETLKL